MTPTPPVAPESPTGTPIMKFLGIPAVAVGIYIVGALTGTLMAAGTLAPGLHLSDAFVGINALVFAFVTPLGALSQGARK